MALNFSRKRILFWFLIFILLFLHIINLRSLRDQGYLPLNDFIEYWSAARCFLDGENPYSPKAILKIQREIGWKESRPLMMWNPPWILPILIPFSRLDYWTDRALWYLINLVAIFGSADWFWRRCGGSASRRWLSWVAVVLFVPAGIALYLGQISPLLLAGVGAFLKALEKKWFTAAGASLLLIAIKPHVLYVFWFFLLVWIIRDRQWKVLWGFLFALTSSCLFVLYINPSIFIQFLQAVTSPGGPTVWQTPTWGVALIMLFAGNAWVRFFPSFVGLCIACLLWLAWRKEFRWQGNLATILLLSVTTSSFTWTFDWIVLLPVVVGILVLFEASPVYGWKPLALLIFILILAMIQPIWSGNYFYTIWLPPALWLLHWVGLYFGRSVTVHSTA